MCKLLRGHTSSIRSEYIPSIYIVILSLFNYMQVPIENFLLYVGQIRGAAHVFVLVILRTCRLYIYLVDLSRQRGLEPHTRSGENLQEGNR